MGVLRGSKEKTSGGLTKGDLVKSKTGRIVGKKASAAAKKRVAGSKIQAWSKACQKARKELNIKGFCPLRRQDGGWQGLVCQSQGHLQRLRSACRSGTALCSPSVGQCHRRVGS